MDEYKTYSAVSDNNNISAFIDEQYLQKFSDYCCALIKLLKFSEDNEKTEFASRIVAQKPEEVQRWIKDGINIIEKDCCPFCNRPLDDATKQMISAYNSFAKSERSKTKEQLALLLEAINKQYNMYQNYDVIKHQLKNYEKIMPTFEKVISKISGMEKYICDIKDELTKAIASKLEPQNITRNISTDYELSIDKEKFSDIKYINSELLQLDTNLKHAAINKKRVRDNYIDKFLKPKLAHTYSSDYQKLFQLALEAKDKRMAMDISKETYLQDLSQKKPLIKKMNEILNDIGLSKFQVDPQFNLVLNSKNISHSINSYLSDGEKTVIAFSLFVAEIALKFSQNIELIVIDDPISSLDYDFIYNIKSFIDSLYDRMKTTTQFIVLTHNNIFYNMLKYRSNQNFGKLDFSIAGSIYVSGEKEETLYMEKLKVIKNIAMQESDVSLEQKTFIPNHCRFILENVANFFFPNTNCPIDVLESDIRRDDSETRINKGKLTTLFSAIQIGSHSLLNASLDQDSIISDPQYKEICRTTIKIVKKYCPRQLEIA